MTNRKHIALFSLNEIKDSFEELKENLGLDKVLQAILSKNMYVINGHDLRIQGELIEICLSKGADLNKAVRDFSLSLKFLSFHKDFLLNHPTNPLSPTIFLTKILGTSYNTSDEDLKLQAELIELCLSKGANINEAVERSSPSLKFLEFHKDFLLNHPINPLSPNIFLKAILSTSYNISDENSKIQRELIELCLRKGANINEAVERSSPSLKFLEIHKDFLLNHPINPLSLTIFLVAILSTTYNTLDEDLRIQGELIELCLSKGANINEAVERRSPSLKFLAFHKDFLLNHPTHPLSPSNFLKALVHIDTEIYKDGKYEIDQEKLKLVGELISVALDKGADSSVILSDRYYAGNPITISTYKELLFSDKANTLPMQQLLEVGVISLWNNGHLERSLDIIQYAIQHGADINADKDDENSLTILEHAFSHNTAQFISQFINEHSKISSIAWGQAISDNPSIEFLAQAIKIFPNSFSPDDFYAFARAHGVSVIEAQAAIDIYKLAEDYVNSTTTNNKLLSDDEIALLGGSEATLPIENYRDMKIQNQYGFTPLQLALLGKKFPLVIKMIEQGYSLTEKNFHELTFIELAFKFLKAGMLYNTNIKTGELSAAILEHSEDVDIISHKGESFVDSVISNEYLKDKVLAKTKDPLFTFFKPNVDLFAPSKHPENTHIAISHDQGFWSTGLWSWARLAHEKHPNVQFYLVTLDNMKKGGDDFIKQFDGWMNPGGGDDYPINKKEFSKADWKSKMDLIKTYQEVLDKTFELQIPYTGMCAGAQNLVLYHQGSLYPVKDYSSRDHTMIYFKGTLAHFMAMTKEQQETALEQCEFPEIMFKGDTAHGYAGVTYKLGEGIELGAISEDGVAMSYAHENGLRYATQFHPEHHYHLMNSESINHETIWLDNFIHLANLHHDYRTGQHDIHPETLFQYIGARLEQCMSMPSCFTNDTLLFNNSTMSDIFFDNHV